MQFANSQVILTRTQRIEKVTKKVAGLFPNQKGVNHFTL
jgi:hypothetical protein